MNRRTRLGIVVFMLGLLWSGGSLFAQATRTWVSGVGDDANPCSRTAPCKTFAGAISKTAACGEIDTLDPGGYGALTITKSITIDGGGNHSSVLASGTNGFVISLTSADSCQGTVILRNLSFNGINAGLSGIRLVSSSTTNLHIEHVDIQRFQKGIDISPSATNSNVFLRDVDVRDSSGDGIALTPGPGSLVSISAHDVRSRQNGGAGIHFVNDSSGTLDESQFSGNGNGVVIDASTNHVNMTNTIVTENSGSGLQVTGASTFLNDVSIFRNGTGLLNLGVVYGFGNNALQNNTVNVSGGGGGIATLGHP